MAQVAQLVAVSVASTLLLAAGCASSTAHDSSNEHAGATANSAALPPPPASLMTDASKPQHGAAPSGNVVTVGLFGETTPGNEPLAGADGEGNLTQVSFASEGGDFNPDIDRSGRFIVYASKQHSEAFDIYRKSVDGRTVTQLVSDASDDMMPALSPDGTKVAFVSNRNGNWDVFVVSSEGGPATQITFEADDEVQPTWSPDGKKIAFARKNGRTSRWEIWSAQANEPSGATYLCDGFLPRWCPDVKQNRMLFQRARQQGSRLYGVWTIDIVNGEAMHPTEIVSAQNAAIIQPNWSPDGTRIVFTTVVDPGSQGSDLPQSSALWTINVDGTARTALATGPFRNMQPVWGPDDRIYFVSNRGGIENIWMVSASATSAAGGGHQPPMIPHGAVAGVHESAETSDPASTPAPDSADPAGDGGTAPAAEPSAPPHGG
ncbi:MAG: DPP IV N-terminal domain-containing protein [Phycisphaerales bacterium]